MKVLQACVLLTALGLGGCATTPVTFSASQQIPVTQVLDAAMQQPSPSRTERVLLIRDKGFLGSFVKAAIAVDGKKLAVLAPSQRVAFYLSPGHHMFTVGQVKNILHEPKGETYVDIKAGGPNNFRLRLIPGNGPKIERSTQISQ